MDKAEQMFQTLDGGRIDAYLPGRTELVSGGTEPERPVDDQVGGEHRGLLAHDGEGKDTFFR